MSYPSPELGGMSVGLAGYSPASADFGDAEDLRPLGATFDIGGHGQAAPYSAAVGSLMTKQMEEIRGKSQAALALPGNWKRKLREFLTSKNNDLLDFLKVSVPSHPVLGPGEILMRRFGNPSVTPSHPSVRDFVLDVSGEDVAAEIGAALDALQEGGLKDYMAATRLIFEEYRMAGDELLKAQQSLKAKLDRLDRIQGRLAALFELDPTKAWEPLAEATESYLKHAFEENAFAEEYQATMRAYRRFVLLRDVVLMTRAIVAQEAEPVCTVCLHETVQFALVPCGHTFCGTCMRRQNNSCFMCRNSIKDRVRLYFG